jgi:hypothetical protein
MEAVLVAVVIAVAVVTRPLEARLWRSGRLSDEMTAILLLARFPVVCFLFGLIQGAPPPLLIGITVVTLLPVALFYRFILDLLREQAREARR